jgi:predicted regulator of Ras-like GTPase activity (Roadblock/LC7/MglB family)
MEDRALTGLKRLPGVNAAFVVEHGRAPSGGADASTEAQGAALAALVSALGQLTGDMDLGTLGETIVQAERGAIVAGSLGSGRAAVVVADARANLGMIRMELRKLHRAGQAG